MAARPDRDRPAKAMKPLRALSPQNPAEPGGRRRTAGRVAVCLLGLTADVFLGGRTFADTLQNRLDIGVGSVASGHGSGPGTGRYKVFIDIDSHQRYAVYADDGGHEEWWCISPDTAESQCGQKPPPGTTPFACGKKSHVILDDGLFPFRHENFIIADGVTLTGDKLLRVSGPQPFYARIFNVDGSLNACDKPGKWEWPSESYGFYHTQLSGLSWDFFRRTERPIPIARFEYVQFWNGASLSHRQKAQWFESDSGVFDDDSEWAYFNVGDMITKCLQGGTDGVTRSILPKSQNFYWHLCSKDGTCDQAFTTTGVGGLHYNIALYYNVDCKWKAETQAVRDCEDQCELDEDACLGWNPHEDDVELCEAIHDECVHECWQQW